MFQRISQYPLREIDGRWYRPRAYGTRQPDGMWGGWLLFFPVAGGAAISSGRETTQSTFDALVIWASGLTDVYLDGAFARALRLAQEPLLDQLAAAEYEALEVAERFEAAASIEQVAARVDEVAAATARAEAERIREQRLATEGALAATEEAAATLEAEAHERAAQEARAAAADAARRGRTAEAASRPTRQKSHRNAKRR
jgi:hypothetical protein